MDVSSIPKDAVYKIDRYYTFSSGLDKTFYYGDRTTFKRQITRYSKGDYVIIKAYYFWDNVWNHVGTHDPSKKELK